MTNLAMVCSQTGVMFALVVFPLLLPSDTENDGGCFCKDFCQELPSKQWEQQYFFPRSFNKLCAKYQRTDTEVSGNVHCLSSLYSSILLKMSVSKSLNLNALDD